MMYEEYVLLVIASITGVFLPRTAFFILLITLIAHGAHN